MEYTIARTGMNFKYFFKKEVCHGIYLKEEVKS
jgi:hypothetical protein